MVFNHKMVTSVVLFVSGYIGSESFLRKVNEIIRELKDVNPKLKYGKYIS